MEYIYMIIGFLILIIIMIIIYVYCVLKLDLKNYLYEKLKINSDPEKIFIL